MKTTIKIILIIAWILILPICIFNPEQIVWKVFFVALWVFISWIAVEMKREATDDEMTPKR